MYFRRYTAVLLCCVMLITCTVLPCAGAEMQLDAKGVILMEATTGRVLYEDNADVALPPASVTKVMTLLLVMEAIEQGKITMQDTVQVSEHAASMGGSQIFLEPGETMSVEDLLKSVVMASANDAAVALAEYVSGSEESFVARMNERASELGMNNTHFENTNGLDDNTTSHLTSARDIAIMSCALIRHRDILRFTTLWQDSVRNGAFTLTNTNRLIRFYRGATGLKTGSTSKARFCISATAERDGLSLVCVVMGSPTRDIRNEVAKKLLDYGFSNYSYYTDAGTFCEGITVKGSNGQSVSLGADGFCAVLGKGEKDRVQKNVECPEFLNTPVQKGDAVGQVIYSIDGKEIGRIPLLAQENVEKIGFFDAFLRILRVFCFS